MPELPDVEIFTRYFRRTARHKKVAAVEASDRRILKGVSWRVLNDRLSGTAFLRVQRHGKYLFAGTERGDFLTLHFGMTGSLHYFRAGPAPLFTRFLINFKDGGHLAFVDSRVFGKVMLVTSPGEFVKDRQLGPDALAVDPATFRNIFQNSRAAIKAEFLDQRRIAGIGNIYADEILFQSRVHPAARGSSLSGKELTAVFRNMKKVLKIAIRRNADPLALPDNYLLPHREKNGKCPRWCGAFATATIGGRTTYFCPKCQGIGK